MTVLLVNLKAHIHLGTALFSKTKNMLLLQHQTAETKVRKRLESAPKERDIIPRSCVSFHFDYRYLGDNTESKDQAGKTKPEMKSKASISLTSVRCKTASQQ